MPEKIIPKSAYVDGAYVGKSGLKALAEMPSKEELLAKMLGSMQAPIANFRGRSVQYVERRRCRAQRHRREKGVKRFKIIN